MVLTSLYYYLRLLLNEVYLGYRNSFFLSCLNYSFPVMTLLLLMIPSGLVCVGASAKLRGWSCVNYSTPPLMKRSVFSRVPPQTSPRQRWGSSATWPSCSSACPTQQSVPSSPPSSPSFPSLLSPSLVYLPPTPAFTLVGVSLLLFFFVLLSAQQS